MKLSDLEAKYKQKAYNIFDGVLNIQKELDVTRIDELRKTSKSILQNNNIFENKKNEFLYQLIEDNLHNLEENINMYNQDNLENILQGKIYDALDNISYKLESLEQNEEYSYEEYEYNLNDDLDENLIKNALLNYLNKYKSSIVENLEKNRYSQNTIDSVVEQIEESMYNDYADILIEKIIQDGIKNVNLLKNSLIELTNNTLIEIEDRYNCSKNGIVYDEFKQKRVSLKEKAKKVNELMSQIDMLDSKIKKFTLK